LKKAVLALKPGQVSDVIVLRDSYRILKLVAKEAPGQRELSDPTVQQPFGIIFATAKNNCCAAYLAGARNDAKVTNYLAHRCRSPPANFLSSWTPKRLIPPWFTSEVARKHLTANHLTQGFSVPRPQP